MSGDPKISQTITISGPEYEMNNVIASALARGGWQNIFLRTSRNQFDGMHYNEEPATENSVSEHRIVILWKKADDRIQVTAELTIDSGTQEHANRRLAQLMRDVSQESKRF